MQKTHARANDMSSQYNIHS